MKEEAISFKVDSELAKNIRSLPNRSAFIRNAVLHALQLQCPLCKGSGVLDEEQQHHWLNFKQQHHLEHCNDCHSNYLVCDVDDEIKDGGIKAKDSPTI